MKRWIAVLLSFVMVLSLMPMAVMAEEAVEGPPITALYVGTVNALETPSGDGWSFNRETGVLTLNNCTLTESMLHVETDEYGSYRYDSMIYIKGDLTIELIGTNSVERVIEEAPTDYTHYYAICSSIWHPSEPGSLTFTGSGNLTVGIAVTADSVSEDGWNMDDSWEYLEYSAGIGCWTEGGADMSGLYGGGWMDIYGGIYGVEGPYNVKAFANYPTFGDNCIVTAYQDVEGTVENENGYNWNNNDAWRMKVVTADAYLKSNGQLILLDKGSASGEGWTWENSVLTLSENTEVKAVEFRRTVGSAKVTLTGDVTLDATDMGYDANWNSISAVTAYCDLEIDAGDHTLTLHNSWADALRAELCDVTISGGTVVTTNEGGYAINMIGGDLTIQNATFRSANEIYLTEGYDADYNTIPAGDAVLSGAVVVLDSPITSYGTLTVLSSDVTVTWGYDALYGNTAVTVRDSTLTIAATGHALTSNSVVTVDNCNLNLTAEEAVIYHGYYHYEGDDESNIPDTTRILLQNMDITQPEGCSVQVKQTDSDYYTKYEVLVVDGDGNPATTLVATAAGNEHEHSYENGICSCGAKQTFTITWKNADGTVLEVDTVEYGVIPEYNGPTPTKEVTGQTCTFVGWGTVVAATADKTYTASFYQTYNKHDVILMDGDTELGRYEVTYNVIVSESKLPEYAGNPTKPCCTIAGWQYADGAAYSSTRMPDEDMVLYIVWDGPNHSYEAVVTAPGCGTGGYTTHTCSGCGDSYVSDETEPLGEHSYVEGICSNCGAIQTFTVTWVNWDGTVLETDTVEYGTVPTYDGEPPTRPNVGFDFKFYGWALSASGAEVTPGAATKDVTYYAKYTSTVHKHNLIFLDDDGVTELGRYETNYSKYIAASWLSTAAGNPTKACCILTGWTYADGSAVESFYMPDEDVIFVAVWDGPNHMDVDTDADHSCDVCGAESVTEHSYEAVVIAPTCTDAGYTTYTCNCGDSYVADEVAALGHSYDAVVTAPTCTEGGYTTYTCACGDTYTADEVAALGHSFVDGTCGICGAADPNYVMQPTLTLKAPALEFKDMIKVIAFFTAENIDDVVEMGMVTYTEQVDVVDVNTAAHVIPGAEYEETSGRYFASSQGIFAKYLGDTVYLACYAKLSDGSYVYTKLAPYSPITYATNQLKNSTNTELKQLVVAMLNYSAAAQTYFNYNTDNLSNATLTEEQKALPEAFRDDMVTAVPTAAAEKQGIFANNKGFSVRKPAISFEGAFSINYFFTPAYAPVDGITLYYWLESDFEAVDVLTMENATGSIAMDGTGMEQYRGDIEGIAAKNLDQAVYVAAVYSDGTTTWTSGVLGYSIGAYCSSMAKGTDAMAELAMATAVYGYHAKQYFGS